MTSRFSRIILLLVLSLCILINAVQAKDKDKNDAVSPKETTQVLDTDLETGIIIIVDVRHENSSGMPLGKKKGEAESEYVLRLTSIDGEKEIIKTAVGALAFRETLKSTLANHLVVSELNEESEKEFLTECELHGIKLFANRSKTDEEGFCKGSFFETIESTPMIRLYDPNENISLFSNEIIESIAGRLLNKLDSKLLLVLSVKVKIIDNTWPSRHMRVIRLSHLARFYDSSGALIKEINDNNYVAAACDYKETDRTNMSWPDRVQITYSAQESEVELNVKAGKSLADRILKIFRDLHFDNLCRDKAKQQ